MFGLGPVDCRRGVLMLEEKHVTVLGGEVDNLLERNNYKNILLRKVEQSNGSDALTCKFINCCVQGTIRRLMSCK